MRIIGLYAAVVLIWGTTWAAIPYQLGVVAAELSVAYRFAVGSMLLFLYAAITGRSFRIPLNSYVFVLIMGVMLFSASYLFVYYGTAYLTSGLVAVTFSFIVVSNGLYERLFFATAFEPRMLLATAFGIVGMTLLFWPEISDFSLQDDALTGVILVLISVFLSSFGTMAAIASGKRQLPIVAVNAHAMGWGAFCSFAVAMLLGRPVSFSLAPDYLLSLAYLAVFGSAVAFGCFLALLRAIGSARAAYSSVLYPLVALLISTLIEDYRWSVPAFAGLALILTGNWLALTKTNKED